MQNVIFHQGIENLTTMRYLNTPTGMSKLKKHSSPAAGDYAEQEEL